MIVPLQIKIMNDPLLNKYLKENSHWYKYLNRSPKYLELMIEEMKISYKITPQDKMNKFLDQLNVIRSFMEIIK